MKKNIIESYLRDLERELRLNGLFNADLLAEVESHLFESVERGLRQGLSREAAEKESLKRFGSVKVVSSTFEKERITPMQKILLAVATISGLFITYVDSRPAWDDTGITAGVILLLCGLIALIGYQRPWLLALVVGAWIPLYGLFVTHNFASVLALIIAFVGAYAGWAFRMGIRKTFKTA
jgi:hypothetical protein